MRRSDREVTDFDELVGIIRGCDTCRLALNDSEGYPYILPLNFGVKVEGESVTLYFHGATEGKKHELIKADNRATFEMDCDHNLLFIKERGYCTMNYRSVIGRGRIEYVTNEAERIEALTQIVEQYHHDDDFKFNHAAMPRTSVFKLIVESMTGKAKNTK